MNSHTDSSYRQLLRPLQLTAVVFFTVSGGPYGLEPVLQYVGGNVAIILIFLTPILWSLPAILMVLELNGMMPKNGGYYQWVKSALGLKWGFFEGWWTWIFTFVDLAIYPVLFVQYLCFFMPEIEPYRLAICLAIIWGAAALNLLGIVPVGRSSVALGIAVLVPFVVLFVYAFTHLDSFSSSTFHATPETFGGPAFAMGLFTVMWNYLGWDNSSSFVEEVDQPVRSYLVSILAAFLLILGVYFIAIFTGTSTGMNAGVLQAEGFPSLGTHVGGWWLGALLSLGGMASALGLFLSILLAVSRIPKAMADDRILPAAFSRMHPLHNVPHVSIIVCAIVVSGMVMWTFADLLIIDVTLYSAALSLEFVSLIVLRVQKPDAARPFRIPLNVRGLVVMAALPALCLVAALFGLLSTAGVHTNAALFAIGAMLTGPLAWWVVARWRLNKAGE